MRLANFLPFVMSIGPKGAVSDEGPRVYQQPGDHLRPGTAQAHEQSQTADTSDPSSDSHRPHQAQFDLERESRHLRQARSTGELYIKCTQMRAWCLLSLFRRPSPELPPDFFSLPELCPQVLASCSSRASTSHDEGVYTPDVVDNPFKMAAWVRVGSSKAPICCASVRYFLLCDVLCSLDVVKVSVCACSVLIPLHCRRTPRSCSRW